MVISRFAIPIVHPPDLFDAAAASAASSPSFFSVSFSPPAVSVSSVLSVPALSDVAGCPDELSALHAAVVNTNNAVSSKASFLFIIFSSFFCMHFCNLPLNDCRNVHLCCQSFIYFARLVTFYNKYASL